MLISWTKNREIILDYLGRTDIVPKTLKRKEGPKRREPQRRTEGRRVAELRRSWPRRQKRGREPGVRLVSRAGKGEKTQGPLERGPALPTPWGETHTRITT